ncbi:MAG: hypothetical protein LBI30_02045, partial [Holosporales bacterium]|nr:hypothetical protein [Holosporales bacterium]
MCNAKAIMIVGTCLAVFSNEDVLSAKLSAKEIAALKAQLKAEILAEIKAEQAKEKAKRLAESKELPRSSSAD